MTAIKALKTGVDYGTVSVFGRDGVVTAQTGDYTQSQISSGAIANGTTATTQTPLDNSTKVATTAYVDAAVTAEAASEIVSTGRITLATADVKALMGTPFQLVAGLANKGIVPTRIAARLVFNTTAFSVVGVSDHLYLHYASDSNHIVDIPASGFIDASSNKVVTDGIAVQLGPLADTILKGAALQVSQDGASEWNTTGDGSLQITVWYGLVDLS